MPQQIRITDISKRLSIIASPDARFIASSHDTRQSRKASLPTDYDNENSSSDDNENSISDDNENSRDDNENSSLQRLDVQVADLKAHWPKSVLRCLSSLTALEELRLVGLSLWQEGAGHLTDGIRQMSKQLGHFPKWLPKVPLLGCPLSPWLVWERW